MKKCKVFIFIEESVATQYGIGTYVKHLAFCLHLDFSITVIKLFTKGDQLNENVKENIRYLNLPYLLKTDEQESRYFKRVVYFIKKYVKPKEVVCFHFNNRFQYLSELLKKEFVNAKLIYTIHYLEWKTLSKLGFEGFENMKQIDQHDQHYLNMVKSDKLFINNCDFIIVLSIDTYKIVTKLYSIEHKKVFHIPNSVSDIYDEELSKYKEKLKIELGFDKNAIIILFVGRIVPNKGVVELIDAFKRILPHAPDCKLVLIGDGCFDLCLKNINPYYSKLSFTGFIEKDLLIKFYHIADVGVLPSYFEECSYTALEMMSVKLPLIITKAPGLSELSNKSDILMVKCRDVESLAIAILKLVNSIPLQKECSLKARLIYEKKYSMDVFKRRILSFYKLAIINEM